jgi:hypothetical protein
MPLVGYALVAISSLALVLFAVLQYRQDHQSGKLIVQVAALGLVLSAVVYFLRLPSQVIPKGPNENQDFLVAVAAIYVSIVLGMLAEGFYNWLDKPKPKRRGKLDWGVTLKPLFVSPILLIPTIAAFQNANIDLMKLDFPRLMILLTAFEKGFLWRHYLAKNQSGIAVKKVTPI